MVEGIKKKLAVAIATAFLPKVFAQKYYDPINDAWWVGHRKKLPCLYAVYQYVTGDVVSSGQIERDFGVWGDALPPKRNSTVPQFFQAQVSARVNFDALPTFEDMPQSPMTEAAIRAALPPAEFGVSVICVGAPVERDELNVQEVDMEDEGMEEVGEMGDSDGLHSSEEAVHDLTSP